MHRASNFPSRVLASAYAASLFAVNFPAAAQTDPAQKGTIQDSGPKQEAPPNAAPSSDKKPDENKTLSEKLKEGEGVLKPPPAVDPEIKKPTPPMPDNKMPVIVPPGEPGGDPTVQPK